MPKKRPQKIKRVLPLLRIYCEGEKTEPNYIRAYLAYKYGADRKIDVIEIPDIVENTPVQLVECAVKVKNSKESLDEDKFWVVYDREAKAKYPDKLHKETMLEAEKNEVDVAFSNVCFEFWMLLHFTRTTKEFQKCDDVIKSEEFRQIITNLKQKSQYSKSNKEISLQIVRFHETAEKNARWVNNQALSTAEDGVGPKERYKLSPYTDVYCLLNCIDGFIEEYGRKAN